MKYRIIADTHFWHQFLIDIWDREEGYEEVIKANLATIPKDHILIHLWDICIGNDWEKHDEYIQSLNCKKVLVRWNHDRKSTSWYLDNGWDFVCTSFELRFGGYEILFTHKPTPTEWKLNIHWHLHKNLHHAPVDLEGECFLYSCELMWYKPLKLNNIIKKHNKNKKRLVIVE